MEIELRVETVSKPIQASNVGRDSAPLKGVSTVGHKSCSALSRVPYTLYDFFIKNWMFLELFLFAKKMKFLTKGRIHYILRSSLGTSIVCAGTHWSNWRTMIPVLLIPWYIVYTCMYCCIHST